MLTYGASYPPATLAPLNRVSYGISFPGLKKVFFKIKNLTIDIQEIAIRF
jgi:hypothetical protein